MEKVSLQSNDGDGPETQDTSDLKSELDSQNKAEKGEKLSSFENGINTKKSDQVLILNDVETELQTKKFNTVDKILDGCWMKGDFVVFITYNRESFEYNLELFNKC